MVSPTAGLRRFREATLSALERLLRPAPADKWKLWCAQLGYEAPQLAGPTQRIATCGHDMTLEHAVTEHGECRACVNEAIIRRRSAA